MKRIHKRFTGFLLSSGLVTLALVVAPVETFATYVQTIGLLYAVYLGGQSATDWRNGSYAGNPQN